MAVLQCPGELLMKLPGTVPHVVCHSLDDSITVKLLMKLLCCISDGIMEEADEGRGDDVWGGCVPNGSGVSGGGCLPPQKFPTQLLNASTRLAQCCPM